MSSGLWWRPIIPRLEARRVSPPGRRLAPHFHDEDNLILVSWGSSRVRLGGHDLELRAPALIYIPAGLSHACNADPGGGLGYSVLAFDPEAWPSRRAPREATLVALHPWEYRAQLPWPGAGVDSPWDGSTAEALETWAAFLARRGSRLGPAGSAPKGKTGSDRATRLAEAGVSRLEEGLGERLSLGGLAEDLGASPWALIRAFEARYDLTPGAYLQSLRVNRARALLRQGQSPAQVALECGFCDQGHLGRVFRRVTGLTPGAYASRSRAIPSKTGRDLAG